MPTVEEKGEEMGQRIILSTGNPDKAQELRHLLGAFAEVVTKDEAGYAELEVEETGETLEENARLKVVGLYRAMLERGEDPNAVWILADDTGLFVEALDGRPGIYAARYAGPGATYGDNVAKLIGEMQGVAWENRGARFRTVIALCRDGVTETVEGFVDGRILERPRGDEGFGYDPVFYIPEEGRTLAEMSEEEKNLVSHRGRAYRKLRQKLADEGMALAVDEAQGGSADAPDEAVDAAADVPRESDSSTL